MNTLYIQYKLDGEITLRDVVVKIDQVSHAWEIKAAIKKKHQYKVDQEVKIVTLTKLS